MGQEHDREPKQPGQGEAAAQHHDANQQQPQADQEVKPECTDLCERQHLEWENNFFDEIRLGHDDRGPASQCLGHDMEQDEA